MVPVTMERIPVQQLRRSHKSDRYNRQQVSFLKMNVFATALLCCCFIPVCHSFAPYSQTPRQRTVTAASVPSDVRNLPRSRFGFVTLPPPTTRLYASHTDVVPSGILTFANDTMLMIPWERPKAQGDMSLYEDAVVFEDTTLPSPNKARGRWLLLVAAALYGTNFACVKLMGGTDLPMGLSSTLRFGLAALCTSPWLFAKPKDGQDSSFVAGFEVGIWTSIGYLAQAIGLETTLASESAFLCSLAVVVVPLLDWMTGKRLKTREMVGAVLALVGVGLLELGDTGLTLSRGDLISMIQPLAFGVGFWRMEATMRKFPNQANRSTAAQLLAVFLVSGVYTCIAEGPSLELSTGLGDVLSDPILWLGLIWTGCVTTGLSVYMETVALETLSAAETTLILSTEPLWGSLTAACLLGESFGPTAMAGGALVVAACVWSNLGAEGLQKFTKNRF